MVGWFWVFQHVLIILKYCSLEIRSLPNRPGLPVGGGTHGRSAASARFIGMRYRLAGVAMIGAMVVAVVAGHRQA